MASSSSLLSEDQFQCSICRDVFTEPVSTPCGHNFCKACISGYWDTTSRSQCPMCKHHFYIRPELKTNTTLRDVADHFKRKRVCDFYMENLEDRIMCKKHNTLLELFCRTDQMCVCQFCTETDHKTHHIVHLEEECGERKMIQERMQKGWEIKHSVELSKRDAEREITDSMQVFTDLDHLQLLQSSLSLCTPPNIPDKLKIPDNLKSVQQYAVDVTLDPDTANPFLGLSADGKQVSIGQTWNFRPENPKRFVSRCILGKEGFSSGRFYYEVQVKGRNCWELGVARESIDRSIERTRLGVLLDSGLPLTPEGGFWTVGQKYKMYGSTYEANTSPSVTLTLETPQKVGVFVDYEEGQVSFYNVETKAHIFSFTGCNFTEKLYPFFDCGFYDNNDPALIISPVSHTD
uniref:E3 ubiquitin-protein ligase TRIM39-like n=1 Tax=Oncorhynchus tshawytscha TaxID=74940 RepID=A0A8C8HES1_ONCTS